MGTEDEDAFDVAGAAGSGDESGHAGPLVAVVGGEGVHGGGKVRDELVSAGDDDVVWGEDRESAAAGAAAGDHDRAGLSDEEIAGGDPCCAGFERSAGGFFGPLDGEGEAGEGGVAEFTVVRGDAFPAFVACERGDEFSGGGGSVEFVEFGVQIRGIAAEESEPVTGFRTDGREDAAGFLSRLERCRVVAGIVSGPRGGNGEGAPDSAQNVLPG